MNDLPLEQYITPQFYKSRYDTQQYEKGIDWSKGCISRQMTEKELQSIRTLNEKYKQ
jgi:hypothetical protein